LIAASEDVQEQDPLTLQLKDAFVRLDKQALEPALKSAGNPDGEAVARHSGYLKQNHIQTLKSAGGGPSQMLMESFFLTPDVDPLGAFRSSDEVEALQVDQMVLSDL
jgi:hypothetical protein